MTQEWNPNLYDESHSFVAKFGEGILAYLNPKPKERILDLGCGTGDLTNKIHISQAKVIGVDSSSEMIERAVSKFPKIEFIQADAKKMQFDFLFDAIFSNAVLHWIAEKEKVIKQMKNNLKKGGRIVLEFGGKGNNEKILKALRTSFTKRGYHEHAKIKLWYYPSIGEYSMELEKQGFRVTHAEHFDRITPLKGKHGIKNWLLMFGEKNFIGIPKNKKEEIVKEVENNLKDTHYINGVWQADYKRIRIIAINE